MIPRLLHFSIGGPTSSPCHRTPLAQDVFVLAESVRLLSPEHAPAPRRLLHRKQQYRCSKREILPVSLPRNRRRLDLASAWTQV